MTRIFNQYKTLPNAHGAIIWHDQETYLLEAIDMRARTLLCYFSMVAAAPAFALDTACDPVMKASEVRINQPAWHSVADLAKGKHMETMKVDGQFYQQMNGKWKKVPFNLDETERKMLEQVRAGEIKLSECNALGNDTVDGKPVNVVSSRTEIPGAPVAGPTKLYIGKSDGLPYKQVGEHIKVIYSYSGIAAPMH